jgi:hypothetical protein
MLTEFFTQFTEEERMYTWLKQDSATAHIADDSLPALEGVFDKRWFMASTLP